MTAINTTSADNATATASPDTVIKCAGLTKIFRDFWMRNRVKAVDAIDLDVHRGEVFGLLGPNGSGKSTTIKLVLGLLHPTAGKIAVFGKRPDDVATKKQIGYLPEESYLYRFLNARETLDYYGKLFHLTRDQRRKRIDMLLDMVGLNAVQRRPIGEYSKGMQRRIGLAQALINDPQLLILDEPTSGLDPIGTRQIKDLIVELSQRGKTIVMCSHLLGDVEDVCDRVSIMFGGKVRMHGTVDELLVQQNLTTIESAELDEDTITAVDELLQSRGKHIERVEHPRQRLEALFLDIVDQAQQEGQATSGATSGGEIAEFLVDHTQQAASEQIIDQLVQSTQRDAAQPPAPAAPQQPAPAPEPAADQTVINDLVEKETQPEPASAPAATTPPATPPASEGAGGLLAAAMDQVEPYVEEDQPETQATAKSEPADDKPAKPATPPPPPPSEKADQSFINALMEAAENNREEDDRDHDRQDK